MCRMGLEWNIEKAEHNLRKHGISFREAVTVFRDPLSRTYDDPKHSWNEFRFVTIGASTAGRILIVAHTDRGKNLRIISARKVTVSERAQYEEGC